MCVISIVLNDVAFIRYLDSNEIIVGKLFLSLKGPLVGHCPYHL